MRRAALTALVAVAWVVAAIVLVRRFRTRPTEGVVSERPLKTMTRDELYELARARDIPGRSRMKKDELRAALEAGSG